MRLSIVGLLLAVLLPFTAQAAETGAVTTNADGQVTLTWTASGDDGAIGRANHYDLRYNLSTMNATTFPGSPIVPGVPAPQPSGTREYFTVTGLMPNTTYYFAMKVGDEVNNWSPISNVIQKVASGTVGIGDPTLTLSFSRPMPNPAGQSTRFTIALPTDGDVSVEVFDVSGRRVRTLVDEHFGAGRRDVAWDLRDERGNRVDAGMFLVRAQVAGQTFHQRLVVLR